MPLAPDRVNLEEVKRLQKYRHPPFLSIHTRESL